MADIDQDGFDDIVCVFDDVLNDGKVRAHYIRGQSADLTAGTTESASNVTVSSEVFVRDANLTLTGQFVGISGTR